ncbi:MAG TPA: 5-formyltetrahydrofolate cyclo-ligase [Flavobacterium sp.]|nr:5-formyltetrahydrofolate cyclo-ligase [Flavobacterium sp.]HPJ09738.1 5-formyltetrahydrofolate cyclo-ligase [Flavobacterium sp.]
MTKKELRVKYKQLRSALSETEIEELSLAIANQLLSLDLWDNNYFHVFLPIDGKNEVDTQFVMHILSGKDKEIVVSRSDFESVQMTHFLLTDNTKFKKNAYGIPEPVDGIEVPAQKIQVVFVPLLAFDQTGNRVGYGKGFYDTLLTDCALEVVKVGLSFFEAETAIDDVFTGDVRLDYCVTPQRVYTFPV